MFVRMSQGAHELHTGPAGCEHLRWTNNVQAGDVFRPVKHRTENACFETAAFICVFMDKIIEIWAFPADLIYCERLNPAERIADKRQPINLRLFK